MFLTAEAFFIASGVIFEHFKKGKNVIIFPAYVNQAFACELYLKCLLQIKTPFVPKHHKLHLLFDSLPKPDRSEVIRHYKRWCKADPMHSQFFNKSKFKDDLRSVLEAGADVFETLRYAYEDRPLKQLAAFSLPILALHDAILEARPEWKPKRIDPPTSQVH